MIILEDGDEYTKYCKVLGKSGNPDSYGIIFIPTARELVPENLEEAKYLLSYVYYESIAENQDFKKNWKVLLDAMAASTLDEFVEALPHFDTCRKPYVLSGLEKGLEIMGYKKVDDEEGMSLPRLVK